MTLRKDYFMLFRRVSPVKRKYLFKEFKGMAAILAVPFVRCTLLSYICTLFGLCFLGI